MELEQIELIGVIITIVLFWGRVEHRITKIETRMDYYEKEKNK